MQALGWRSEGRFLPLQDDISSVVYWYQTLPGAPFPALPGTGCPGGMLSSQQSDLLSPAFGARNPIALARYLTIYRRQTDGSGKDHVDCVNRR